MFFSPFMKSFLEELFIISNKAIITGKQKKEKKQCVFVLIFFPQYYTLHSTFYTFKLI